MAYWWIKMVSWGYGIFRIISVDEASGNQTYINETIIKPNALILLDDLWDFMVISP